MKTTVIHHSADFDGIFCREIARKFLPDAQLVGWDFGDKPIEIPNGKIYVMDLPVDRVFGFKYKPEDVNGKGPQHPDGLVWIDHHKSSIETHPNKIQGYRIDGVAACRLAWFWFEFVEHAMKLGGESGWIQEHYPFAKKEDFIDRKVSEPLAVRLAGEYDIWDKRDPNAELFQHGLRSCDLNESGAWSALLNQNEAAEGYVHLLLDKGKAIQYAQKHNDAGTMGRSFIVKFEGLTFLALNTARCNSISFAAKDIPKTGHDALMGFYFDGAKWNVSLYHANHRKDLDLSIIAVKHGGGGHRGACGFQIDRLPFLPA